MQKYFISSFLLLFVSLSLYAQRQVSVTGRVVYQSSSQALEYATIAFISAEGKTVAGDISNSKGRFKVELPAGTYNILVEYIGFESVMLNKQSFVKTTDMGDIKLKENLAVLEEAEVVAEKTTVELHLDKKIYNVGSDLTLSGGSVSDVLDNVPSVSVDVEGNISLRGNENVRILINGKPSGLSGISSAEGLQQLPAEAVQKVEIITSPSARYDAEGTAGILNIVLKRNKMQGFNGSLHTHVNYPWGAGISANLNYRVGDFNFFTTSGYRYRQSKGYGESFTQYFNNSGGVDEPDTYMDEHTDMYRKRGGISSQIGVEWYLNPSSSFTLSALLKDANADRDNMNGFVQMDTWQNAIISGRRQELKEENDNTKEYAFNFTKNFNDKGHKLTIDAQYEEAAEEEDGLVLVNDFEEEKVITDEEQKRYLLQADYVLPFSEKGQFELGYKASYKDRFTDYQLSLWQSATNIFEVDENVSNILEYNEHINAFYTQYGNSFGEDFTYLLGLRYEHSEIDIRQKTIADNKKRTYGDFFPTLNLSYAFNKQQSITLGYARRIRRPHPHMLNPFPSRSSLTDMFQGNPNLNPAYSSSYDLAYLYRMQKLTLSSSIYYQHTRNMFTFVSSASGETVEINGEQVPVIKRGPINLSTNQRIGTEATLSYSPMRKWRINANMNLFHSAIEGNYKGVSYDAEHLAWFFRLSNKYTLPAKVEWQTRFMYMGPRQDAQNKRKAMMSLDMAWSKDVCKDKATITFNISDILNSRKRQMETTAITYYNEAEFMWRARTFTLSFVYRFNEKKKHNSHQTIDNDDEGSTFF